MHLSEFISRCQSDEIETIGFEEINSVNAEFRRQIKGLKEGSRIKPVCFENFIYYLRNERWSDARIFLSGAVKEYLMLPCSRKLRKQNGDNQQIKSATDSQRVNQSRDSEQGKGRKTALSVGTQDNKTSEISDTLSQSKGQTQLHANETNQVKNDSIYSEQVVSQTNSESY
ncbi:hypothetical protein CHS0354_026423 [Potamilus streckersoni]|uniref:Uncharacterized protein n=1 Tax=Potamilus streckersoni TaxID=2493646 RepID=A0AAE0W5J0_9BIVA|nr:hypothetical protein CHS0354_026423 [Potamilus streckersoni]